MFFPKGDIGAAPVCIHGMAERTVLNEIHDGWDIVKGNIASINIISFNPHIADSFLLYSAAATACTKIIKRGEGDFKQRWQQGELVKGNNILM